MTEARRAPVLSSTRLLRIVARIFAAAAIVFGALLFPSINAQLPFLLPWWDAAALFLVFGLPIVMGLTASWCTGVTIRRIAAAAALGQLLVMATWLLAMRGHPLPAGADSAWVLGASAIGTTAAGLAWRPRIVWIHLVATCVFVIVIRSLASPQPLAIPLEDALYTLMFDSIFAALAVVTVRAGLNLDRAAEAALFQATQEGASRARVREKSRVDALIHDGVLATLLLAAREEPELRRAAERQAERVIEQIEDFAVDSPTTGTIGALEFVWRQQATTTEIDPEADFDFDVSDAAVALPIEVETAFSESVGEALRNISRHASIGGTELHRGVHVNVTADHVLVMVVDDGSGFDPAAVAPGRLGIAVSIRGRMDHLAGGSSRIISQPGDGTLVVLNWERP